MSCHLMYPETPPIVKITQWVNRNEVIHYYFVSNQWSDDIKAELKLFEGRKTYDRGMLKKHLGEVIFQDSESAAIRFIFETLYTDDSINNTVHKLSIFLGRENTKRVPYIWTDEGGGGSPLRFNIQASPYAVNPFMAKDRGAAAAVAQFTGERLLWITQFNLVFYEDLKGVAADFMSYYFPSDKDVLNLTARMQTSYLNEQSLLNRLWKTDRRKHQAMTQQSMCVYNRALFKGTLNTSLSLTQIFNALHSSKLCSFIQFVDDLNHIYYKVFKHHRIPLDYFDEWTSMDKMNGQTQVVLYSFLQETSKLYAQIRIDSAFNIYIFYKLDFSENVTYDILKKHSQQLTEYLQQFLNIPVIKLEIETLSLRTNIMVKQPNLKSISKYISSLLPIYNVDSKIRIQKNLFDLQFKRIQKYGQTKNIRDYIKSRIALDIPLLDIIIDLQEYGMDEAEVRDYFEEIRQEHERPIPDRKRKDIRNIGLLMHLSVISFGIQINIDNASSFHDIHNALFWTRAALLYWESLEQPKGKGVGVGKAVPPVIAEEDEVEEVVPPRRIVSQSPPRMPSDGSELSLGSDDEFEGGAIGKEYRRFFNTMLKQIDPNIFTLTKGYATKCQISDLRQPVGITKEQKAVIDASPYKDGYDNAIEYGSDPKNPNVYICPRIWCPKSQVPLSPDRTDQKCPLDDEEPMLLYKHPTWHNSPETPHYVGYLKETGHNDVKLPCCFKNIQKGVKVAKVGVVKGVKGVKEVEERTEPEQPPKVEDEGYIIDKPKQLADSRIGTIPQSLHEFLYPTVPYQLCKNNVKTAQCLLRRGIPVSKDSFLTSVAYLMGIESKSALIKHLRKSLDPLTFMTLEDGMVLQSFLPKTVISPEKEVVKRKAMHAWLTKYPSYRKVFNIDAWMDSLLMPYPAINDIAAGIRYQMARHLTLYDAYLRFNEYIAQEDEKNPQFFYDLLHKAGVLLIVWNRDNQSLATVKCPYATKLKQWWVGQDTILPFIMLFKQDNYYEPLVLVDPSKNITQRIGFSKYQQIKTLLQKCQTFQHTEDTVLYNLYTLQLWVENFLLNPSRFYITHIVLDYNYRVKGFMTHGHLWIDLPVALSTACVPYLKQLLPIDDIIFWEDIQGSAYDIKLSLQDYRLFATKVKQLNLGLSIGSIRETTLTHISTLFTVPMMVYTDLPRFPIVIQSEFTERLETIDYDNSQWYKTKKYILHTLLSNYKEYATYKPAKLYAVFKHLNQPTRVTVLMEELPLGDLEALQRLYDQLLLAKVYYLHPGKIYEGHYKKEWIFSQKSIELQDITFIKNPLMNYNYQILPKATNETVTPVSIGEGADGLPDMMVEKKCEMFAFPTKWRSAVWKEYSVAILKKYKRDSLLKLVEWIAHEMGVTFNQNELFVYTKKSIYDLLTDARNYPVIFEDVNMRKVWNNVLGRQYRNANELIEVGLKDKSVTELQKLWVNVLATQADAIWMNDIDLFNISRLLKINFFIIIKGKSADKKTDDLLSSCKFICSYNKKDWKYRPLVVLYKETSEDKTHSVYGLIKKDKSMGMGMGYYHQTLDCPEEILQLIIQK